MAYRDMTAIEIAKRIGQGDLVVYVEEEYGFREWFWFPDMSEADLVAYWEKCNIEDHFFNPSGLPGDMVRVPPEEIEDDHYDHSIEACPDPEDYEDDAEFIEAYDAWCGDWYPNEHMWRQGYNAKDTWRAHTHLEDDSWLRRPGE